DGLLAPNHRQNRHAEVDRLATDLHLELAILRLALLGDVQLGHDLDARSDVVLHALGQRHRFRHRAILAVAHDDLLLEWFDMDVGDALVAGVEDHLVDQLDDRRVLVADRRKVGALVVGGFFLQRDVGVIEGVQDAVNTLAFRLVALAARALDLFFGADNETQLTTGDDANVVELEHIERVGYRDRDDRTDLVDREHAIIARYVLRNGLQDLL